MFELKDEYLTGIEEVDKEHRRLFEIADQAYHVLNDDFIVDKYDNIRHILEELYQYTKTHFAHEEAYMEKINYKRIYSQKIQHRAFIAKLESYADEELEEGQDEKLSEILNFLVDWLVNHIMKMDKRIGH